MGARATGEHLGQALTHLRPGGAIALSRKIDALQASFLDQ